LTDVYFAAGKCLYSKSLLPEKSASLPEKRIKTLRRSKALRLLELEKERRAAEAEYGALIGWAEEVREEWTEKAHLATAEKLTALP